MMELAWDKPFGDQLDFFGKKGFKLSPDSWRDVWQEGHARAFTVARVTTMDVLEDIRKAVDSAVERGITLKQFKKDLIPTLTTKGWFAPDDEDAKVLMPDGTVRKRLAGWRLDNILRTNFASSYHVGRFKQQQSVKEARPYLQYRSQQDPSVRDAHRALDGVVKKQDDPFWDTHYPPNGFGCRCYTKTLSERQMEARGLKETGAVPKVPVDEGWDYNVGKTGLDAWRPDLKKYPPKARKVLTTALNASFLMQFLKGIFKKDEIE